MQFALEQTLVEVCETAQPDRERREEQQERNDCCGDRCEPGCPEGRATEGGEDALNVVSVARTVMYWSLDAGS